MVDGDFGKVISQNMQLRTDKAAFKILKQVVNYLPVGFVIR